MGLLALNFTLFISALLAIYCQGTEESLLYCYLKPLTTILIILIPIAFGNKSLGKYFYSVVLGLLFCLLGDVFLLNDQYFIFGLLSFLVAHLLFAYSFISLGGMKYLKSPFLALALIGFAYLFFLSSHLGDLFPAVAVYLAVILFMCWQGLCLYMWKRQKVFGFLGLAVLLFVISDAVLALNKFYHPFDWSGIIVLTSYWASIALLANSTVYVGEELLIKE